MKKPMFALFTSLVFTGYFTSCGTSPIINKRSNGNGTVKYPPLQPSKFETFSEENKSNSVELIATKEATFRSQSLDSNATSTGESCIIPEGLSLDLKRMFYFYENEQIRVTLNEAIDGCPFSTGYIEYPNFTPSTRIDALIFRIQEGKRNAPAPTLSEEKAFQESLKHILLVEGTECVNHEDDPGGPTKKGITEAVAKENGYHGDICDIPDTLVNKIYKEKYWDLEPTKHPWPLNLAVMNTCVNSGCGKAKEFVRKLPKEKSVEEQANWFVDQQTAYYHYLTGVKPAYKSFIKGWVNRSNYMKEIIASAFDSSASIASLTSRVLTLNSEIHMAKAYESPKQTD